PAHEHTFDFSFESAHEIGEIKRMIAQEIVAFKASQRPVIQRRPSVRTTDPATSGTSGQPRSDRYEDQVPLAAGSVPAQAIQAASAMDIDPNELERELAGYGTR
ncbi:mitogen activated protein kinase 2, partial [Tieghemiomyces parasiticus]